MCQEGFMGDDCSMKVKSPKGRYGILVLLLILLIAIIFGALLMIILFFFCLFIFTPESTSETREIILVEEWKEHKV